MPVIRRLAGIGVACASLVAPVAAQTIVADAPGAAGVPLTVPPLKGADYPARLGPSHRGAVGRPRAFARVRATLLVEPACSVRATSAEPFLVRCPGGTPYRAAIGSDAGPDEVVSSAFASAAAPQVAPVAIAPRRLTVEY
ncbi:hypothetical protein HL653_03605 [Sphingomonas sp. AP4-R1]|uniref:hypothetical protein n=1 Tax=Sphingomonas sp. AP4-R1 TaxID=2735134 RepID=UPI001493851B|nr:hypothetical protein [Sphingomonas sp. AP4-R1]QJU56993.1 hypothetical protein HL653_03605 [Sphingomonas sp. AP4-R1]